MKIDAFAHICPARYLVTRDLARLANDEMAALVHDHDRCAGFAAGLPLNDVDASLAEVDRVVADLGAVGSSSTRTSTASRSTTPVSSPCSHGRRSSIW